MLDYTPGSDIAGGAIVVIAGRIYIANGAIASGRLGAVQATMGRIIRVVKETGAIADKVPVAWKATGDPLGGTAGSGAITATLLGNVFAGIAWGAAAETDTTMLVLCVGLKTVCGQHTTVAASDTVVTGLSKVLSVVANFSTDPADANFLVSTSIGDQAGTPAAGSFLLKTWQNTSGNDPTPAAAGSFSKVVNWIAVGY